MVKRDVHLQVVHGGEHKDAPLVGELPLGLVAPPESCGLLLVAGPQEGEPQVVVHPGGAVERAVRCMVRCSEVHGAVQ